MAAAGSLYSSRIAHSFVLAICLLLLRAGVNADCNYAATCGSVTFSEETGRPLLSASCPNCNGVVLTTAAVDLNQRVTNNDGHLQCTSSGGRFAATCSDVALSGSTLSASCQESGGGSTIATTIDLNNCISNINGNLVWCVGSSPCGGMASALQLGNSTVNTKIASSGLLAQADSANSTAASAL